MRRRSSVSRDSNQGWTRDDRPGGARCKVRLRGWGGAAGCQRHPAKQNEGRRHQITIEPRIDTSTWSCAMRLHGPPGGYAQSAPGTLHRIQRDHQPFQSTIAGDEVEMNQRAAPGGPLAAV